MIANGLFQTFLVHIWEIFYWKFGRFTKNALTLSIFELEKCYFFKQVRISPEIDWYHYQSTNAAPMAIVRHRIKKDRFWWSVMSEPTGGSLAKSGNFNIVMIKSSIYFYCLYKSINMVSHWLMDDFRKRII